MKFQDYLKHSAVEIDKTLASILSRWSRQVSQENAYLLDLAQIFIEASKGGKRLRGTLVKLGFEMATGVSNKGIFEVSSAFEVFQTAILVHDDVIDKSKLRRGRPTIYQSLGGNHYGVSQAICLGDVGFFLSFKIISESSFPTKAKNLAIQYFSQAAQETVLGQMLDVELPRRKIDKKESDILFIAKLKTAYYSLIGPLSIGVVLAGGTSKLLQDIVDIGEKLGMAFQIKDDILGIFGDEKSLGKPVTSDVEEGKNTLILVEALKRADNDQKQNINKIYGKSKVSRDELEKIREIFMSTGALRYSEEKAQDLVEEGKKAIYSMQIAEKYKDLLAQMADFLILRQK